MTDSSDLLAPAAPAARRTDPPSSHEAADALLGSGVTALAALQRAVLDAIAERGPITARDLELLPRFRHYAPSTVRKRASELHRAKLVDAVMARPAGGGRRQSFYVLPAVTP